MWATASEMRHTKRMANFSFYTARQLGVPQKFSRDDRVGAVLRFPTFGTTSREEFPVRARFRILTDWHTINNIHENVCVDVPY